MATARKGPKVSPPSTAAGRKRWPAAEGDEPDGADPAAAGSQLVEIARGLAATMTEHGLSELIVDTPDATFTLRRGGDPVVPGAVLPSVPALSMPVVSAAQALPVAAAPVVAAPAAAAPAPAPADDRHVVTSPFVGTFYRRPNPDAPEYVKQGDRVRKGEVLCIVEAMKLMNEIEADVDGVLAEVLVSDASPVEYGQPLFKIAPS